MILTSLDDSVRLLKIRRNVCCTSDTIDSSIAAAGGCRLVAMGPEATAVDRADAVQSPLEQYVETPSNEAVFRDSRGAFNESSSSRQLGGRGWLLGCIRPISK